MIREFNFVAKTRNSSEVVRIADIKVSNDLDVLYNEYLDNTHKLPILTKYQFRIQCDLGLYFDGDIGYFLENSYESYFRFISKLSKIFGLDIENKSVNKKVNKNG